MSNVIFTRDRRNWVVSFSALPVALTVNVSPVAPGMSFDSTPVGGWATF